MADDESDILQGTLDLMVLKTLDAMGPQHGYGIARRIEQIGEDALQINQGTIYLCLVRLVNKRWISAESGVSENNRKARFYSITKSGRKQLAAEAEHWQRVAGVIGRLLREITSAQDGNAHRGEIVWRARLAERLVELPEIQSVAVASHLPLAHCCLKRTTITLDGRAFEVIYTLVTSATCGSIGSTVPACTIP